MSSVSVIPQVRQTLRALRTAISITCSEVTTSRPLYSSPSSGEGLADQAPEPDRTVLGEVFEERRSRHFVAVLIDNAVLEHLGTEVLRIPREIGRAHV